MALNTNLNSNSNSKSIIVGIGLVLLSIVILVIFNHQRFNDTREGFQVLETQKNLNIDESLFAVLDDYQDYNSKINSINDEITNYNIQLMDNVLNEAQRNEVKSKKTDFSKHLKKNKIKINFKIYGKSLIFKMIKYYLNEKKF